MRLSAIQFVNAVPVFGTGQRLEHFDAGDGWLIDTDARGVVLSRPANPSQNIREVPPYRVVGVGYCEPVAPLSTAESKALVAELFEGVKDATNGALTGLLGDGACADVASAGEQRADAGGAPQAPKQAQGGPKKARAKVTP